MSKSYAVFGKLLTMGERKGETVYSVRPVSYGTLTTDEVAKQISNESTATPADVKAVLDRYAYYVIDNLKKGYSIELLGFGTLYLRFITEKSVTDKKKANANLVKALIPGFRPSFTVDKNGKRTYDLIPERITLVKYKPKGEATDEEGGGNTPTEDDNKKPSGEGGTTPAGGGSGSSTGGGDTGKGDNTDSGSGTGSESNPKEFD